MVSINAALAVDVQGQVVADTIHGGQYSRDRRRTRTSWPEPGSSVEDRSLLCLPSTIEKRRRDPLADRAVVRAPAP